MLATVLACLRGGVALGAPVETRVALPLVPPPHVRFPDGFDEQGCARFVHDGAGPQRVCPATRTAGWSPSGDADWVRYLGYEGPRAPTRIGGTGMVLLPDTLTVASHGWWRAVGLVRNDGTESAPAVRVTVALAAADGRLIGRTTTLVPVRQIRPGEPAPFELRTLVPAEAVGRVTWSLAVDRDGPPPTSRMVEIEVGRIAPHPTVASRRLRWLLGWDAAAVNRTGSATIGWGILRSWGPRPISRPAVVGMWLDEQGRAVRMVDALVHPASRHAAPAAAALLPGGTLRFELYERDADGTPPAGWRLALWQTTS